MHGDRISLALSRIEAAARRIRSAGGAPTSAAPAAHDGRYEKLRQETEAALAELDRLIERLEA